VDNIALIHNTLWVKGARILLINEVFHIINNYTAMETVGYFVNKWALFRIAAIRELSDSFWQFSVNIIKIA